MREENRRHIMEMLDNLVLEGHHAFPSHSEEVSLEQQEVSPEQKEQALGQAV